MKCSAFIATSADGYIATPDGGIDWLESAGNPPSGERQAFGGGGFDEYLATVDCMIMGRGCMEKLSSFDLPAEQWPYGDIPIYVLSKSVSVAPDNLQQQVEMYAGEIPALVEKLAAAGYRHAYVDGGATITSFINHRLLGEITVSQAPILLGAGLPLIGKLGHSLGLSGAQATAFSNDFIQWTYTIASD